VLGCDSPLVAQGMSELDAGRSGQVLPGVLLTAGGAVSYGVTVVIGRSLTGSSLPPETVLGARFSFGGLILVALLAITGRSLLPAPGERWRAFLLGAIGYSIESSLFYAGLQRGTAAAVALLFYSYPLVVAVFEVARGTVQPSARLLSALALGLAGSATIVAAGSDVSITSAGVAFTMASAVSFAAYLIVSSRLLSRSDAMTSGAWTALGAGLSLLTRGLVLGSIHNPTGHWDSLLGTGLATASAFALMFAGLRLLGPTATSVVLTLEAFSAVVLAAIFLDEAMRASQLIGGIGVLAAGVLVASQRRTEQVIEMGEAETP
jgi:drug/metabolite transporter (DMT)-like permease